MYTNKPYVPKKQDQTACAVQAPLAKPISAIQMCDSLDESLLSVEDQIAKLEQSLGFILSPESPTNACAKPEINAVYSPIVARLNTFNEQVRSLRFRIENIITRNTLL